MLTVWKVRILSVLFVCVSLNSMAEDIDLFAGAGFSLKDAPNVLIILDNTANWNQAFKNEISALAKVIEDLEPGTVNIGLMMFSESGGSNGNPGGGYVRGGIRFMDADNKPLYQNLINSLHVLNDKSSGGKLGITMAEAYYYFSGANAYSGHNKTKRDYAGNSSGTLASNAIYALPKNAFSSISSTKYTSPVSPDSASCQKNYIIYISNGPVQDNNSDTATANALLKSAGGDAKEISLTIKGSQSGAADEWARFMAKDATTKVVTYTIDVDPIPTGQGPGFSELLKSMAGGADGYYAVNSSEDGGKKIELALNDILSQIQAVNSVFASASLPVSVNTQGTYLNQIFIGMFRPDGGAAPRWHGNLKQYQLKEVTINNDIDVKLADADNELAINGESGFIKPCARSFWTPDISAPDSYWSFDKKGICLTIADSDQSNTPDGDIVEKGGSGFHLRAISPASRVVKTCTPGTCTALTSFDSSNGAITQALLGALSAADRTSIINWARGTDVKDENKNANMAEMRPSSHGDVIHSRPVAIDYGESIGVVVFYGANDGFLHAINGNQGKNISTFLPGSELWAFIAPEHYPKLKRLYDNSPDITFPSAGDSTAKPYFFDGPISAHKEDSTVWIYAAQRRGGRMIYAFDASSPTNPSLKWRQGCPNLTDDTGCTTSEIAGIGQTWSAIKVMKSSGYTLAGAHRPMVIMGGGYDTCEDGTSASDEDGKIVINDLNTCTGSVKGNKVFVLDADSGAVLKVLPTDRSVVGDITVVSNYNTGLAEYAYATDTGGNIYRITIGSEAPGDWSILKIASLGCEDTDCPGGVANRKFLFSPDVVVTPDFNAILVGSGDRERPLLSNTTTTSVDNAFFMVKDNPAKTDWWALEKGNCQDQALACTASLLKIDPDSADNPSQDELDSKKGWYLSFDSENHDKEQVVTSAIVVYGVLSFGTHTPTPVKTGSCGLNLGTARYYNINYLNAAAEGDTKALQVTDGGLPVSSISARVSITDENGETKEYTIVSGNEKGVETKRAKPTAAASNAKQRVYWLIDQ